MTWTIKTYMHGIYGVEQVTADEMESACGEQFVAFVNNPGPACNLSKKEIVKMINVRHIVSVEPLAGILPAPPIASDPRCEPIN